MPDAGPSPEPSHLHAGYQAFGLQGRTRALCTCGYATSPREDVAAALTALLDQHGAAVPQAGEDAGFPYS